MIEQKPKIGKKGAAKEIAKKFSELRRQPISDEILRIVEESSQRRKQTQTKIAKPLHEAEA